MRPDELFAHTPVDLTGVSEESVVTKCTLVVG
jgi:hypothetical protein